MSSDTVAFMHSVVNEMAPRLRTSNYVVIVADEGSVDDVTWWVQIGCAVALDKPILLVLTEGVKPAAKARAVADEIVEVPAGVKFDSEQGQAIVEGGIAAMMMRFQPNGLDRRLRTRGRGHDRRHR